MQDQVRVLHSILVTMLRAQEDNAESGNEKTVDCVAFVRLIQEIRRCTAGEWESIGLAEGGENVL